MTPAETGGRSYSEGFFFDLICWMSRARSSCSACSARSAGVVPAAGTNDSPGRSDNFTMVAPGANRRISGPSVHRHVAAA